MLRLALPSSALALAGASLALAACGSSDTASSPRAGKGQGTTRNAVFQKFQQCLKDNGVTLPNRRGGNGGSGGGNGYGPPPGGGFGGGAPGGANRAKFQKAVQACARYRPRGAGPGGYGQRGNGNRPRMDIKAFTPYLTCLKDQGLDIKVSDGFNALRNLKRSDPKVQAAFKTCQAKLPQRPRGTAA